MIFLNLIFFHLWQYAKDYKIVWYVSEIEKLDSPFLIWKWPLLKILFFRSTFKFYFYYLKIFLLRERVYTMGSISESISLLFVIHFIKQFINFKILTRCYLFCSTIQNFFNWIDGTHCYVTLRWSTHWMKQKVSWGNPFPFLIDTGLIQLLFS